MSSALHWEILGTLWIDPRNKLDQIMHAGAQCLVAVFCFFELPILKTA